MKFLQLNFWTENLIIILVHFEVCHRFSLVERALNLLLADVSHIAIYNISFGFHHNSLTIVIFHLSICRSFKLTYDDELSKGEDCWSNPDQSVDDGLKP